MLQQHSTILVEESFIVIIFCIHKHLVNKICLYVIIKLFNKIKFTLYFKIIYFSIF